jgi:hypothetical protein
LESSNLQLHPTEPANYAGSYTKVRKSIVDKEIAMTRSASTILTSAMQKLSLLKMTVSEEQEEEKEEEGLKN